MPLQLPPEIEQNAQSIVESVGCEAVDVYRFLSSRYSEQDPKLDMVYQFVFRSFYRLDRAGLTPEFKIKFFELLSAARKTNHADIPTIVRSLSQYRNQKDQPSLQFSFASKLANSVSPESPIYDAKVASVFGFRVPFYKRPFDQRLDEYMVFYEKLKVFYYSILEDNLMADTRALFRDYYQCAADDVPETKILDFIFWSTGRLSTGA